MFQQARAANKCLVKLHLDAIQTNLDICLQLDANIFETKNLEMTISVATVDSSSTRCIGFKT
jgi:hypothetical protein